MRNNPAWARGLNGGTNVSMINRVDDPHGAPTSAPPASDVRTLVDQLLDDAVRRRASDVHVDPTRDGAEVKFRIDGLLETVARHDATLGRTIVTRLMVIAKLLTYRLDVPQEGRVSIAAPSLDGQQVELRISIMPTTHGPRAAVRLPAELTQPQALADLSLPANVVAGLKDFASADSGMLIVTGPAGSGKTTTLYALLRFIAQANSGLSIVTLEDPVERDLPGVVQVEVSPFGQLTYERALRSILRQDPQVLMLGEIRDAATASLAVQAALSGHRLLCTLHAGTPAGALVRLLEMKLEPYQLTSAVFGIVAQRLLRRRAETGYRGRVPVAEFVRVDDTLRRAIRADADSDSLTRACEAQQGHRAMRVVAGDLIASRVTDAKEVNRVLGLPPSP